MYFETNKGMKGTCCNYKTFMDPLLSSMFICSIFPQYCYIFTHIKVCSGRHIPGADRAEKGASLALLVQHPS